MFEVPFAVASTERVPNLLGRLGVLDRLQVDFDTTLEETRISAPWLNQKQRRIWDAMLDASSHILSRWHNLELPPPADEAARRLIERASQVFAAAAALMKLHRAYEGPLLARACSS